MNKIFAHIDRLGVVAFVCGFVLMAFELAGARILAPAIGSSTYTWTSVIGVIIAALSLGYWVGGRVADKRGHAIDVARLALATSLTIAGALVWYDVMLGWIAEAFVDQRIQGVIASLLLFAPTSFLLGAISPYLAKLKVRSLTATGRSIADLSALNALGSITGTFVTGFVLFGHIGSHETMAIAAFVMVGVSWLIMPRHELKPRILLSLATIFIVGLSAPMSGAIVSIDTPTARYNIVERDGARLLLTGPRGAQSGVYVGYPDHLAYWYVEELARVVEHAPNKQNILMLGGGAFTLPRHLAEKYPDSTIDVVEIDSQLADIARQYFYYDDPSNVNLIFQDARTYVNQTEKRYDIVLVDVYGDIQVPFTFLTEEYGEHIKRIVEPDGLVASNMIAGFVGPCRTLLEALDAPYRAEFKHAYYHEEDDEDSRKNIISVYSDHEMKWPGSRPLELSGEPLYRDNYVPAERLQFACAQTDTPR